MFERFTEEARRVVVIAQEEAREAGDPCIDGAHLLLGIAAVDGPGRRVLQEAGVEEAGLRAAVGEAGGPGQELDAEALATLGIDLGRVRRAVESVFGAGALDRPGRGRRRPSGHLPFTRHAKRALELSLRAALRRGDKAIDSRHVLLGVLGADEQRAGAALDRLGVDRDELRRRAEGDADAA